MEAGGGVGGVVVDAEDETGGVIACGGLAEHGAHGVVVSHDEGDMTVFVEVMFFEPGEDVGEVELAVDGDGFCVLQEEVGEERGAWGGLFVEEQLGVLGEVV